MAGYSEGQVTKIYNDDLLASTEDLEKITITLDTGCRDATNPEGSTILRPGLVVTQITASGKYKHFDSTAVDGTQLPENAVVLEYEVRDIDQGDKVVSAFFQATFREDSLIVGSGFDWSKVQRLRKREHV